MQSEVALPTDSAGAVDRIQSTIALSFQRRIRTAIAAPLMLVAACSGGETVASRITADTTGFAASSSSIAPTPSLASAYTDATLHYTSYSGWTYAFEPSFQSPVISVSKDVTKSPPGKANLVVDVVIPSLTSEMTSEDAGRTAPDASVSTVLLLPVSDLAVIPGITDGFSIRSQQDCAVTEYPGEVYRQQDIATRDGQPSGPLLFCVFAEDDMTFHLETELEESDVDRAVSASTGLASEAIYSSSFILKSDMIDGLTGDDVCTASWFPDGELVASGCDAPQSLSWQGSSEPATQASTTQLPAAPTPTPSTGGATPTTESEEPVTPFDMFAGTWTGIANQPGYGTFQLTMELNVDGSGTISYPGFPCSGILTYIGLDGSTLTLEETITSGNCITGGFIFVSLSQGQLQWEYTGGGVTATAALDPAN